MTAPKEARVEIKVWPCEHVKKYGGEWGFSDRPDSPQYRQMSDWNYCPLCGAARPAPTPHAEDEGEKVLNEIVHKEYGRQGFGPCLTKDFIRDILARFELRKPPKGVYITDATERIRTWDGSNLSPEKPVEKPEHPLWNKETAKKMEDDIFYKPAPEGKRLVWCTRIHGVALHEHGPCLGWKHPPLIAFPDGTIRVMVEGDR